MSSCFLVRQWTTVTGINNFGLSWDFLYTIPSIGKLVAPRFISWNSSVIVATWSNRWKSNLLARTGWISTSIFPKTHTQEPLEIHKLFRKQLSSWDIFQPLTGTPKQSGNLFRIHANEVCLWSDIITSSSRQSVLKEFTLHEFPEFVVFHPFWSVVGPNVCEFSTVFSMEKIQSLNLHGEPSVFGYGEFKGLEY